MRSKGSDSNPDSNATSAGEQKSSTSKPSKLLPQFNTSQPDQDADRSKWERELTERITELNHAGIVDKKKSDAIIKLCDQYLQSIPMTAREYYVYNIGIAVHAKPNTTNEALEKINKFNTTYPNAAKISEIQRAAVKLSMLPDALIAS